MYEVTEQQIDQWFADRSDDGIVWDKTNVAHRASVASELRYEMIAAATSVPPCPSWCVLAPGHEYDSVEKDDETLSRGHGSTLDASQSVGIQARERNLHGTVTIDGPLVGVWTVEGAEISASAARALAADLIAAADLLDEITA